MTKTFCIRGVYWMVVKNLPTSRIYARTYCESLSAKSNSLLVPSLLHFPPTSKTVLISICFLFFSPPCSSSPFYLLPPPLLCPHRTNDIKHLSIIHSLSHLYVFLPLNSVASVGLFLWQFQGRNLAYSLPGKKTRWFPSLYPKRGDDMQNNIESVMRLNYKRSYFIFTLLYTATWTSFFFLVTVTTL